MTRTGLVIFLAVMFGLVALIMVGAVKSSNRFIAVCEGQGGKTMYVGKGGRLCVKDGLILDIGVPG